MPSIYGPKVSKKLEFAEVAAYEDLRSMCPNMYTVAQILNGNTLEEEFGPFITNTYGSRYKVHSPAPCRIAKGRIARA
jgi:hypothetical protein